MDGCLGASEDRDGCDLSPGTGAPAIVRRLAPGARVGHVSALVSETASNPRNALSVPDPTQAQVPPQLWLRSGRPMFGTAVRVYVALALVAGALIFVPRGPVFWGMLGAGVLAFMLFPVVIQGLLAPLERRVLAAGRREATPLLQEVRARGLVRRFAPHAWLTLQEGRLHLRRGDGRAAARAFTETVRLSRGADAPALISAQAQALVLAEQPEPARELLQKLGQRQALSAGDQLTLGLALLGGKGNGREALAHVQAAQAGLGDLPRVLAALALALHRADQAEAGLVALQRAQDLLGSDPDPFDEALVQRGVKLLRTVNKAQEKRDRKLLRVEGAARVAAAPVKPASVDDRAGAPAKSARKAKKEERRATRRAAKAEKRTAGVEAPAKTVKLVKLVKAAKVAPKGKAAKAIEPHKQGAVAPVAGAVAKPGLVQEAGAVTKPGLAQEAGAVTKPGLAQEAGAVTKPGLVQEAGAVTKPGLVQEAGAVTKPGLVQEAGAVTKPARLVQGTVAAQEPVAKPVVAVPAQELVVKPVAAVLSQEPGAALKPAAPSTPSGPPVAASSPAASVPEARPEAARSPAPPPGAALFGSVAAKPTGAPVPAFGAPPSGLRLPPRPAPAASGPQASAVETPATASLPAVPKVMSPGSAGVTAGPPVLAGAPSSAAPPVLAVPGLANPPSFAAPVIAAPVIAAPVIVAPMLPVPSVLPQAPAPSFVVPAVGSQPGQVPRVSEAAPPALAQVLPDTDDGWDDMLDALEADNVRS